MYQAILELKELQVYLEKVFQDEGSRAMDVHMFSGMALLLPFFSFFWVLDLIEGI